MKQELMEKNMNEIIDFFKQKKAHTLSDRTFIGVEVVGPIICWMASSEIHFTLCTGNDKRYWRNFEKTLKEKFSCIKYAYLSETDGSCSSQWIVKLYD